MSNRSRWLRFGSYAESLTPEALDNLTSLDDKNRIAWCAAIGDGEDEEGIGLSRYIVLTDEPDVAEFAVTVLDAYKRQGIGTALLTRLLESAAKSELRTLRGYIAEENAAMISLCRRFGAKIGHNGSGTVLAEISLPHK